MQPIVADHGHRRRGARRNAEEIIYRAQIAGQRPVDALVSATSLNAQSTGLTDRVGAIAAGMEADLIAVDGDPLKDITALRRASCS